MRPIRGLSPLVLLVLLRTETPPTTPGESSAPPQPSSQPDGSVALKGAAAPVVLSGGFDQPAYIHEQVMLSLAPGASLEAVAARWDAAVVRPVGRSGFGALAVPPGMDAGAFRQALQSDAAVSATAPMGRVRGASPICEGAVRPGSDPLQWHLGAIGAPDDGAALADYTVAVLDSGAAYEDDGDFVAAPSLASVSIVAPYDFVNLDAHPNDDHQHGTHISSLIVGQGEHIRGVAAGAQLMPVKVLDQDNSGSELELIEGIYWAVDNGADVINMSLSFSEQYAPSAALLAAIDAAWEDGVVMVAASGNDGARYVSWPAASPHVIAVGAGRPASASSDTLEIAGYSNRGAAIDLLAPGGDLSTDNNGDGFPDGIIGESFPLNQPDQIGLWMFAGTSQAAAVASGAALWTLAAGADPESVSGLLQAGGGYTPREQKTSFTDGEGAGALALDGSLQEACRGPEVHDAERVQVAALPWLARLDEDTVAPRIRLTILERSDGAPIRRATAFVNFSGASGGVFSCETDNSGTCTIALPGLADAEDLAWLFSIDTVVEDGIAYHPSGVLFGSDALEVALQALEDEGAEGLLAWQWSESEDDTIGDVAESIVAVNSGTGLASSPLGTIFQLSALRILSADSLTADLDGTGLASSPLGTLSFFRLVLSGDGLLSGASSSYELLVADADGSSNDALGLSALSVHADLGAPLDDDGLAFEHTRIDLLAPATVSGSATGAWADSGGFQVGGYPAASALIGSANLETPAEAAVPIPTGDGSVPLITASRQESSAARMVGLESERGHRR